jgi:hypothetical protein
VRDFADGVAEPRTEPDSRGVVFPDITGIEVCLGDRLLARSIGLG